MNRLKLSTFVFGAAAALLSAAVVHAQDTAVVIGGPNSDSSFGTSNPGTLDDNITVAMAKYTYHLDTANSKLVLTVENISPVLIGIPNPVLTDVFLNTPPAITGVTIASQTGSGHATAAWTITFDADLTSNPNPNGADGFGAFSVHLTTPGSGVQGAIANPLADTLGIPPGTDVLGPVTFELALTGNLTGLTAASFSTLLSVIPPGSKPRVAVGKFQSGGTAGASSFIGPGSGCPVFAASASLGGGCGTSVLTTTPTQMGQLSTVQVTNAAPLVPVKFLTSPAGGTPFVWKGCTIHLRFSQLHQIGTVLTDVTGSASVQIMPPTYEASPTCCGYQFVLQAVYLDMSAPQGSRVRFTNAVQCTLGS